MRSVPLPEGALTFAQHQPTPQGQVQLPGPLLLQLGTSQQLLEENNLEAIKRDQCLIRHSLQRRLLAGLCLPRVLAAAQPSRLPAALRSHGPGWFLQQLWQSLGRTRAVPLSF